MRIAMLCVHSSPSGPLGTLNTGGMSVYVSELARWLGRQGHRIDIYTCAPGVKETVRLHANVRLIHLRGMEQFALSKEQLATRLDAVFSALEQYRRATGAAYDLIHSHYWLSAVVGAKARVLWQRPHLITFHTLGAVKNETTPGENEPPGRIAHERQLVREAEGIIVPVKSEKGHLLTLYGAFAEKVATIACGVNLDRFQPRPRSLARQRLGLDIQDEVVLYVGRFAPIKGVEALLDATARVAARRSRLRLLLVGGDGPESASDRALAARAATLGIEGRIDFRGQIEPRQLADYYAAADFLALPSHYESFGLVVLEAMACGTPVLATPVGIAPAIIVEGLNGTLVEGPDAEAVARGMLRLLTRRADTGASRTRVRATVERYSWERTAEAVARRYAHTIRNSNLNPGEET